MGWIGFAGVVIEGIGLVVAAIGLLKVWNRVADGESLIEWPGKPKTVHGRIYAQLPRVRLRGTGRAVPSDETPEQAITAIRSELDSIHARLEREAIAREDGLFQAKNELTGQAWLSQLAEKAEARVDTRLAAGGLFGAVVGLLLQLIGAWPQA